MDLFTSSVDRWHREYQMLQILDKDSIALLDLD